MSAVGAVALARDIASRRRPPEPAHRRTYDKVRRHSRPVGNEKVALITRREFYAGRDALRRVRRKLIADAPIGTRQGAPGTMSVIVAEVWEYLAEIAVTQEGRVYPRYTRIAREIRRAVSSIRRAVVWLVDNGWLEYDRRFVETGRQGIRGPQVEQTSNWYRVKLGLVARQLLQRWIGPAGDEAAQAAQEAKAAADAPPHRQRDQERLARGRAALQGALDRLGLKVSGAPPGSDRPT